MPRWLCRLSILSNRPYHTLAHAAPEWLSRHTYTRRSGPHSGRAHPYAFSVPQMVWKVDSTCIDFDGRVMIQTAEFHHVNGMIILVCRAIEFKSV